MICGITGTSSVPPFNIPAALYDTLDDEWNKRHKAAKQGQQDERKKKLREVAEGEGQDLQEAKEQLHKLLGPNQGSSGPTSGRSSGRTPKPNISSFQNMELM